MGVPSWLGVGVPVALHEMEMVNTWLALRVDDEDLVGVDRVTPDGPRVGLSVVLCEVVALTEGVSV